MVIYVLRDVNDLIDNMDYAKYILYKYVELGKERFFLWLRAGCLAYRGEVSAETIEKVKNKLEEMKRLGKNVIEFQDVISDDQFYTF